MEMTRASFQKTISGALLGAQLVFVLSTYATLPASADPATLSQSPETTLLTSMIALRGMKMSPEDRAKALESIYNSYDQTAPEQDRSTRLEQSLVDTKILTEAQSAQFSAEAQQSDEKLTSGQLADNAAIQTELQQLAGSFSKGAQFSDCSETAVSTGFSLIIGGFFAGIVGVYERQSVQNSTNPDFSLSSGLLYGGAGAFAIGAVVLVVGGNNCNS